MNAQQRDFLLESRSETRGQNAKVLELLLARSPSWVPMPELERVSGSHRMNSRISDLRKKGYLIENYTDRKNGRAASFYRLLNPQTT